MKTVLIALGLTFACGAAVAGEPAESPPPAPKDQGLVLPAQYRILVTYDEETLDRIREQIQDEIENGLEARRRRLEASKRAMRAQVDDEFDRYRAELEAIRKAGQAERASRERGDDDEAERWRMLRVERTHHALELARRARLIEEALRALSIENWRATRRREREIAEAALDHLEPMLEKIEMEREGSLTPPRE